MASGTTTLKPLFGGVRVYSSPAHKAQVSKEKKVCAANTAQIIFLD